MSDTRLPNTSRSMAWRSLLIAMIAVVVLSLQVGLPWLSYYLVSDPRHARGLIPDNPRGFWRLRFSFERFLNPQPMKGRWQGILTPGSIAICRDELIVCWPQVDWDQKTVDRTNLQTGVTTTSKVSADFDMVKSDGFKEWWLPDCRKTDYVLLWEGQPTKLTPNRFGHPLDNANSFRVSTFDKDAWHSTGRFILVPFSSPDFAIDVDTADRTACCFSRPFESTQQIWYRQPYEYSARQELTPPAQAYLKTMTKDVDAQKAALRDWGWKSFPESTEANRADWCWIERGTVSQLRFRYSEKTDSVVGYEWIRSREGGPFEQQFVPQPHLIRGSEERMYYYSGTSSLDYDQYHLVKSAQGDIYRVFCSAYDGRWVVYRFDEGRWQRIVEQHSPLLMITCLDVALFSLFAFVVPMFLLGWWAGLLQRNCDLDYQRAELAPIRLRGLARAIDVASWGVPLMLSILLHPEVVAWWADSVRGGRTMKREVLRMTTAFFQNPSWQGVVGLQDEILSAVKEFLSVPILGPLGLLTLTIIIGQTTWHCLSGQSLGKWLLGIKVVRSDLRRCSWGRSCLREALFFVDTLMLLSCVPGVVSMLATSKSQRIGDWVTDTVVVRSKRNERSGPGK